VVRGSNSQPRKGPPGSNRLDTPTMLDHPYAYDEGATLVLQPSYRLPNIPITVNSARAYASLRSGRGEFRE